MPICVKHSWYGRGDVKCPECPSVTRLSCVTKLDLDADVVLSEAVGNLEDVVVIGYTEDGDEYFASSIADGSTTLWLIEKAKKRLLEIDHD